MNERMINVGEVNLHVVTHGPEDGERLPTFIARRIKITD